MMKVLVISVLALVLSGPAAACGRPTQYQLTTKLEREYPNFKRALVMHFGRSWKAAAIVSWGEGGWNPYASNGQYLGTFQMGARERSTYGHSRTLAGQAAAAAKYWRVSGWGPWSCKP